MGSPNREAVKVVVIETQYVKTDTTSFKSVVQSLTGKDACVSFIGRGNGGGGSCSKYKRKRALDITISTDDYDIDNGVEDGSDSSPISSLLSKGMSFKDLDKMLLEMPPIEDLQCWLGDE